MHNQPFVRRRLSCSMGSLVFTLAAGLSATSMAGTVDLSTTPPEASTSVAPNLVLTFDDSGSMNWHHSPDQRPYTGKGWNTGQDSSQDESDNRTYPTKAGPYLCAGVITPGITDSTDPRSWSMNGVYYNPDNTYDPPLKADKTSMPDASYTAAWNNGIKANRPDSPTGSGSTTNLSKANFCRSTDGGGYYKYTGDKSSLPLDASGQFTGTATNNLYNSNNWQWVSLATDAQKQNFANWFSYYRTRTMAAVTAMSRAYSPFDKNVRVAWQNINDSDNRLSTNTGIYKFVNDPASPAAGQRDVRDRFYKWLFAMPASGGTPNRSAAKRVGQYFTDRTGAVDNNPYWDRDAGKELVCRQNFHIQMTDGMWNGDNPSSPGGNDTTSIGQLPDKRVFSTAQAQSKVVWNEASNAIVSMADIAFYYWSHDLQSGVTTGLFSSKANRLKVSPFITDTSTNLFGSAWVSGTDPLDNKEIYWNPANDPATWPHLVQYMIGFGASGTLASNDSTYQSLRKGDTAWPVPAVGTDDGRKIDDMWHAALNSRGEFFAASSPGELIKALQRIITSIVSRSTTAVSGSLSSAVLSPLAVAYKAGYDTNDWTGTVTANPLGSDGVISTTALWQGGTLLDGRTSADRVILTSTAVGAGHGAVFSGTTVVNAINAVDSNFGTSTTTPSGNARLAWLRGDRSNEGSLFRQRNHLLGAVVNAQTLYVAQPASGYRNVWDKASDEGKAEATDTGYAKFVADHAKRAPTVYVAANDGMLHAFDATTADDVADPSQVDETPHPGRERWAYVPYSVYGRLAKWSSLKDFAFQPSVDGTPVSRDVYFTSGTKGWHTILAAGLRYGGRGVYALDITDASASESSPGAKVLWEFNNTSKGGENLGYTFGRPNISRLANGKWVVVVPSGYFPKTNPEIDCKADPTNVVCNKFSSLFVLDAQTGELLKEIKTPTTVSGVTGTIESTGLSTPVMGDYTSDQIDEVAFAGDLQGNIWRFDLTGDVSNWKAELFFRPSNPGDRPVTVMPRLFADPIGSGLVVVFGTGKYLASADNIIDSNTKVQAVYGLRDAGKAGQAPIIEGSTATPLVEQKLGEQDGIRGLTTNSVPLMNSSGALNRGWYFKLYVNDGTSQTDKGERVVVDATSLTDTNRAIITTLIPQDNDPCDPAPRGAVMFVDAATGGAAPGTDFGANTGWADGMFQAGALVSNPPTGGFLPVASAVGGGRIYLPGTKMGKDPTMTPSTGAPIWRRRSWQVLNNGQ